VYENIPLPLLYTKLPPPEAARTLTDRSLKTIPLLAPCKSAPGAHSDPSHYNTCPVEGAVLETLFNSPNVVAPAI